MKYNTYRETKLRWQRENRDRVNQTKREWRANHLKYDGNDIKSYGGRWGNIKLNGKDIIWQKTKARTKDTIT